MPNEPPGHFVYVCGQFCSYLREGSSYVARGVTIEGTLEFFRLRIKVKPRKYLNNAECIRNNKPNESLCIKSDDDWTWRISNQSWRTVSYSNMSIANTSITISLLHHQFLNICHVKFAATLCLTDVLRDAKKQPKAKKGSTKI